MRVSADISASGTWTSAQQVKAGQLLAEIQSPELDQQLNQARANLQQAQKQLDLQKANLELARTTMERYKGADKEQAVAKLSGRSVGRGLCHRPGLRGGRAGDGRFQ